MVQRVIVTRVQPHAERWVQTLVQAGYDAQVLPLIDIAQTHDRGALRSAWQAAQSWQAVMFVSSHAVDALVATIGQDGVTDFCKLATQSPRLWCTGPGTKASLLHHGFHEGQIDAPFQDSAQFDSEALWQRVSQQVGPGARVLVVRGDSLSPALTANESAPGAGRDWLAKQIEAAQAQVQFVVAYERRLPVWSCMQSQLASSAVSDESVWLFSSTQGLLNLAVLLPDQDWTLARALCTHARIQQAAQDLGFLRVKATQPTLSGVLASLKSLP